MIKIDPPGTLCAYEALRDAIKLAGSANTFIEIGCGAGGFSKMLCSEGMQGIGLDFSQDAISLAAQNLAPYIASGQFSLIYGDLFNLPDNNTKADIAISFMVMEHVEDDIEFVKKIARHVKPGGLIILGVPGRRDCWSIEDETVGHLRRYDRADLLKVLNKAGLSKEDVWSIAVPIANILFGLGAWLVSKSCEVKKLGQSQRAKTESSGIREIPWKTIFPSWVKIIINRFTMWPLFIIQRLFYKTNLGVTMMGIGRVP